MLIIDSYKQFTFEEFGLNIVLLNYILHDINFCSFNVNIYLWHRLGLAIRVRVSGSCSINS